MEAPLQSKQQINIGKIINARRKKPLSRWLTWIIERVIHQNEINYVLETYGHLQGVDFMEALVQYFQLDLKIVDPEALPSHGRFLFVCNHPLGGLDGICLSYLVGRHYQSSVKYIVNDLLFNLKPLQSIFVPVNKYGRQARESVEMLTQALHSNEPVLTFPAGICSRRIDGKVQDLTWNKSFVKQAVESKRDIVPLFFVGKNSKHFYFIEWLRGKLKIKFNIGTALLPDEMFRAKKKKFAVLVGEPIPYTQFEHLSPIEQKQAAREIRQQVYNLANRKKQ